MGNKTTFIATGDSFMTRRLPKDGYPGFAEVQEIINRHCFKQLDEFHQKQMEK